MKIAANLKDYMIKNKECQWVTKAIRNLGNVLILKFLSLIKISDKLKIFVSKSQTTHSVPRINHGNKLVECCK